MHLAFWFDYACPFSYLASTQVEALAARHGVALVAEPVCSRALAHASGVRPIDHPETPTRRREHAFVDARRYAELFDVPFVVPEPAPKALTSSFALRATLLAGRAPRVMTGYFRAAWVLGKGLGDVATASAVLADAGLAPEPILRALAEAGGEAERAAQTERALRAGIFGTPSFLVNGKQLFWGHDRLPFVERALRLATRGF